VATQGRHKLGIVTNTRDWQEDGVGRLFKELGVPGVILAVVAFCLLIATVRESMTSIPNRHPAQLLQAGIYSVVIANLGCFIVSHQAYSGDPSSIMIVGFTLGIGLGLPRTVWSGRPSQRVRPPPAPPEETPDVAPAPFRLIDPD
jgi:hypothetical protein